MPTPRCVVLRRDQRIGYGFVAHAEKPVIVRFLTDGSYKVMTSIYHNFLGGPSVGHLLPGDEIHQVNGEDVTFADKDHVVELVRASPNNQVQLVVCQPASVYEVVVVGFMTSMDIYLLFQNDNDDDKKSALMSMTKRARLKHQPSRVRFTECVVVGTPSDTVSGGGGGEGHLELIIIDDQFRKCRFMS